MIEAATRNRMPPVVRVFTFLFACGCLCAPAAEACPGVTVKFNIVAVDAPAQDWLAQELRKAGDKVCGWWGATYSGPLTVDVPEAGGPSMALVPAWRGQRGHMIFPAQTVRRRRSATVHEVVHVFAPNANRFLAEGLAVHAHDQLGGPPAFPNFGGSLHAAAARAQQADIVALDRVATPAMLPDYLVAGSFVRFVVERHGLGKFRQLYAMTPMVPGQRNAGSAGRWQAVYGASLDQLAAEWRARIARGR
jgi:hypothetical protein